MNPTSAFAKDAEQIKVQARNSAKAWKRTPAEEEAWIFGGGSGIPNALGFLSGGTMIHPITAQEAHDIYMEEFRKA